jgi:hypothetical protein
MFAYNPTVNDRSGEILGAGQMQAAATNAQAMSQMGSDIGGALKSIGGDIGDVYEKRADGDSAYLALQQMAKMYPSMNKMVKGLSELDPRTRGMASAQVLGNFGALSQFGIAGMNNQTRRDQQALTAAGPAIRSANTNAAAVSSQGGPSLPGASRRFGN